MILARNPAILSAKGGEGSKFPRLGKNRIPSVARKGRPESTGRVKGTCAHHAPYFEGAVRCPAAGRQMRTRIGQPANGRSSGYCARGPIDAAGDFGDFYTRKAGQRRI